MKVSPRFVASLMIGVSAIGQFIVSIMNFFLNFVIKQIVPSFIRSSIKSMIPPIVVQLAIPLLSVLGYFSGVKKLFSEQLSEVKVEPVITPEQTSREDEDFKDLIRKIGPHYPNSLKFPFSSPKDSQSWRYNLVNEFVSKTQDYKKAQFEISTLYFRFADGPLLCAFNLVGTATALILAAPVGVVATAAVSSLGGALGSVAHQTMLYGYDNITKRRNLLVAASEHFTAQGDLHEHIEDKISKNSAVREEITPRPTPRPRRKLKFIAWD